MLGTKVGGGDSQGSHQVACMPVVRQNLLLMIQVPLLDHLLAKTNPQQHLCHRDGAVAPLCQRLQVLPLTGSRSDTENTSNDFVEDSAKCSWCHCADCTGVQSNDLRNCGLFQIAPCSAQPASINQTFFNQLPLLHSTR